MKKSVSLLFTCVALFAFGFRSRGQSVAPDNRQVVFIEDSWSEAVKQARAQHKYIFMDTYATWCGPCQMMRATTFRDTRVAAFFNEHFINVAINLEKGIGPELGSRLGIKSIPTLIVFDENGKPVSGAEGYLGAKQLLKFGQQALGKQAL